MDVIASKGLFCSIALFCLEGILNTQILGIAAIICLTPLLIFTLGAFLLQLINFKAEIE